ncbi:30S ribosomal protein S17 [candidate division WOR-3 bacterium]|nr:30S ribosomal protein S17 [candidate division WOR-3 bacterium]
MTKKKGRVVSNSPDKTIVVEVKRTVKHPLYKKYIIKRKKFYVHDENNEATVGDLVQIVPVRPISKLKRWRLDKIIEKGGEQE